MLWKRSCRRITNGGSDWGANPSETLKQETYPSTVGKLSPSKSFTHKLLISEISLRVVPALVLIVGVSALSQPPFPVWLSTFLLQDGVTTQLRSLGRQLWADHRMSALAPW